MRIPATLMRCCDVTDALTALNEFTERHGWRLVVGALWLSLIIASFSGCLPAQRVVMGRITRIEHDPRYEDICTLAMRLHDPNMCDAPPVCCSHWVTLTDSAGHREVFFAQWPKWAPGLWLEEELRATLRRASVHGICTLYGCAYATVTMALWGDSDYVILR